MINEPKVSVITPCYNRDKYIRETLECLQKMNYQNWECIVIDDESTDRSAEIVKEIAKDDNRIHYYFHKKSPLSVIRNRAISYSSGKYILPVDSDDLISPEYVKEAVEILENNPDTKIVYCDGVFFGDRKGKWNLYPYSFDQLLIGNCIHNSAMFRRSDFDKTKGYNPDLIASEEWDLWINMLRTGGEVFKIEKNYFFYRKHNESTIDKLCDRSAEMMKIVYENNKDLYAHLLENPIKLLSEHQLYKEKYNKYRRLTLRKAID
jgi:glycosyltransferase involved in cell wall biosynthesis